MTKHIPRPSAEITKARKDLLQYLLDLQLRVGDIRLKVGRARYTEAQRMLESEMLTVRVNHAAIKCEILDRDQSMRRNRD